MRGVYEYRNRHDHHTQGESSTCTIRAATVICILCIACSTEISVDRNPDIEVYIRDLCEDRCSKYDECSPVPDPWGSCSVSECIDSDLSIFEDPCFALSLEFFRCRTERTSCEEHFNVEGNIGTSPGSICYEFIVDFSECRLLHPQERTRAFFDGPRTTLNRSIDG